MWDDSNVANRLGFSNARVFATGPSPPVMAMSNYIPEFGRYPFADYHSLYCQDDRKIAMQETLSAEQISRAVDSIARSYHAAKTLCGPRQARLVGTCSTWRIL